MDRTRFESRGPMRGGVGFPLLTLIFVLITVFGMLLFLSPSATVSRGMKNTLSAVEKREEGLLFPLSFLREGSLSLSGSENSVFYNASSDSARSASVSFGGKDLSLWAGAESVTLGSSLLGDKNLTLSRSSASREVWDCGIDPTLLTPEDRKVLLTLLSLSDPALTEWDPILDLAQETLSPSDGKIQKEKGEYLYGNESISLRNYTVTYSAKRLEKALNRFAAMGAKKEVQDAILSKISLLSALFDDGFTAADAEIFSLFLSGKGEHFANLKSLASASDAALTVTYGIKGGKVIAVTAKFSSGDTAHLLDVFFGEKLGEGVFVGNLSLKKGEESLLEFHVSHRIVEDSRTAYVREIDYSVSDPAGSFLPSDATQASGKIRYSWGKEKGDVGLRIITPSGQIGFGGMVEEYKASKSLRLRISRFEVDRINRLDENLTLTLSKKPAEHKKLPSGQTAEAPPEDKKALADAFFQNYDPPTGGES